MPLCTAERCFRAHTVGDGPCENGGGFPRDDHHQHPEWLAMRSGGLGSAGIFDDLRARKLTPAQAIERLIELYSDKPYLHDHLRQMVVDETPEAIDPADAGECQVCYRDMERDGRRRFCRRESCKRMRELRRRPVKGGR